MFCWEKKNLICVAFMLEILRLWQFTTEQKPLCDKCCWCTPDDTLDLTAWVKSLLFIITGFIIACINYSAVLLHIWTETKREPTCLMFANPLMSLTSITSFWFVVKLDLHCHFTIFFFSPSEAHICRERPIICTKLHLCSFENEFSTLPIVLQLLFSFCLDFMELHGRMHVFFLFCLTTLLSPPKEMQPFAGLCGRCFFFSVWFLILEFWLLVCFLYLFMDMCVTHL